MLIKSVLNRVILLVPFVALFLFLGETAFTAQRSSGSCIQCHGNVDQLKKITLELDKKKPKKSGEISGEG